MAKKKQDRRSLLNNTSEKEKADLLQRMNDDRDWEDKLFTMRTTEKVGKKRPGVLPLPALKSQMRETKAHMLPDDYKDSRVVGLSRQVDVLFEASNPADTADDTMVCKEIDKACATAQELEDEFLCTAIDKVCEAVDKLREDDMDAEIWRVAEEAQNEWDEAKRVQIEKEINAAEKAYSNAHEARVRAYKKLGTVTEDTGAGVGFNF